MERFMKAIERILALAFIVAVCLNFGNVVGRYGFGRSLAGADEIQVYIMVAMAFLGAAVVASRNAHLRMDVLVRALPSQMKTILRVTEAILLVVLAGFTLVQSYRYSAQMATIGRTSDLAGIPMWIPHGTVALGFALLCVVSIFQLVQITKEKRP
jgi:TRAP-type C4-dicarboxylate transport system permease small subunit